MLFHYTGDWNRVSPTKDMCVYGRSMQDILFTKKSEKPSLSPSWVTHMFGKLQSYLYTMMFVFRTNCANMKYT